MPKTNIETWLKVIELCKQQMHDFNCESASEWVVSQCYSAFFYIKTDSMMTATAKNYLWK